jgi:hypothetical protein
MRHAIVGLGLIVLLSCAVPACSSRVSGERRDAAGSPDAASSDAGALADARDDDAGARDTGARDGGARDAGPRDAGPMDGGPRDAGHDAASSDGGARADAGARCVGGAHIGLYATDDLPAHMAVHDFLAPVGVLGTVTIGGPIMDVPGPPAVPARVPTLTELLAYDAVFVWGSGSWNGTAVGDVLADYVDAGGGVVIAPFAQRPGGAVGIAGRMETAGYLPYVPGEYMFLALSMGAVAMPTSPIMSGVMSVRGTSLAIHAGEIAPGATLIASWSDGHPLAATLEPSNGRTALLGFYPVRFWDTSTDGARLMANTLLWAARCP